MANTSYDIDIKYNLVNVNSVTNNFNQIGSAASRAEKGVFSLKTALGTLGIGLGIGGIVAGFKHIINYSSQLQQSQIALQTAISSTFKMSYAESGKFADQTLSNLLKFSKTAPGSLEDYIAGFTKVGVATRNVKTDLGSLTALSEKLTAVSQGGVFKGQEDALMSEMRLFLSGGMVRHAGPIVTLLNMMDISVEKARKMNQQERYAALVKGVNTDTFTGAIKAAGMTFDAQFKSLRNNIDQALNKSGSVLTHALTGELIKLNSWFDSHQETIVVWAEKVSTALISGFDYLKKVISFVVDHKDTLIKIAEAYAVFRMSGGLASGLTGLAGGLNSFFTFDEKWASAGNKLAQGFAGAIQGLGVGLLIGKELVEFLDKNSDIKGFTGRKGGMQSFLDKYVGTTDNTYERDQNLINRSNLVDSAVTDIQHYMNGPIPKDRNARGARLQNIRSRVGADLTDFIPLVQETNSITYGRGGTGNLDTAALKAAHVSDSYIYLLQRAVEATNQLGITADVFQRKFGDNLDNPQTKPSKDTVNNINIKMQVASEDPDRFAVQFIEKINDVVNSKTRSIRGGRNR